MKDWTNLKATGREPGIIKLTRVRQEATDKQHFTTEVYQVWYLRQMLLTGNYPYDYRIEAEKRFPQIEKEYRGQKYLTYEEGITEKMVLRMLEYFFTHKGAELMQYNPILKALHHEIMIFKRFPKKPNDDGREAYWSLPK